MKWHIHAIGRPSLSYARLGIDEYEKRLRRYADVSLDTGLRDAGSETNSRKLLERSEGSLRIALDERGRSWSTEDFARKVDDWRMDGVKRASLLVGGAEGHTEELRKRCDHIVALSSFTLQHELALVVLLEQIYRVHTILRGEPYHR